MAQEMRGSPSQHTAQFRVPAQAAKYVTLDIIYIIDTLEQILMIIVNIARFHPQHIRPKNNNSLCLAVQLGIDITPEFLTIDPFHSLLVWRGQRRHTGGNRLLRQHLGPRLSTDAIY